MQYYSSLGKKNTDNLQSPACAKIQTFYKAPLAQKYRHFTKPRLCKNTDILQSPFCANYRDYIHHHTITILCKLQIYRLLTEILVSLYYDQSFSEFTSIQCIKNSVFTNMILSFYFINYNTGREISEG